MVMLEFRLEIGSTLEEWESWVQNEHARALMHSLTVISDWKSNRIRDIRTVKSFAAEEKRREKAPSSS